MTIPKPALPKGAFIVIGPAVLRVDDAVAKADRNVFTVSRVLTVPS